MAAIAPWLLVTLAPATPIAFVQAHYGTSLLPRAKMTVVYTEAQKAGDLNVVIVGWTDADFPVPCRHGDGFQGEPIREFRGLRRTLFPSRDH